MIRDKHYLKLSHFAYERELVIGLYGKSMREIGSEAVLTTGVDLSDMDEWRLLVIRDERRTGFYGVAVQHMPSKTAVIAYRGSEWRLKEPGDLVADLSLITPFNDLIDCQLEQAVEFYDQVAGLADVREVHVTGHSLGGALAQKVALGRRCRTVAFNGPGVLQIASVAEHWHHLRGVYEELIVNYVEVGDIFVGNNPLFRHPGKVVRLDSFAKDGEDFLDVVQFKYHGLSNFYNDLDGEGNLVGSRIEDGQMSYLLERLRNGLQEIRRGMRSGEGFGKAILVGGAGEIEFVEGA